MATRVRTAGGAIALAWLAALTGASNARAQAVSAIDDEALTLPAGVVRLTASESDTRYNSRYGAGGLQPLGADLSFDSLGVGQLPVLAPLQSSLRALTQNPTFDLSLGQTQVSSSVRMSVTPLSLDIGITRRITLHAMMPIVRTHNEIFLNANPNGATGNVGLNPALRMAAALAVDTGLYGRFSMAATSLQNALATCLATPASAAYCPALNAQRGPAAALIAQANAFASGLSQVYGGNGRQPSPVVPVDHSGALAAINQRMQALAAQYAHFDSLTGGPGIGAQGPVGAPPLANGDAQSLLVTNLLGMSYDSLQSIDRTGIGDIELGATALLLDSFHGRDSARVHPNGFNYRVALTGMFRLGTGQPSSPDMLAGVGTGTGTNAVEVHVASDFLIGRRFWASLIVRGTQPMWDQISARIPLGLGVEFAPLFTEQMVGRSLGRSIDVEIDPRYTISDYVGIFAQYRYLIKSADHYDGTFSLDSAATGFGPVTLNANILGAGSETREARWGVGLTFSSVAAAVRHPSRLPFDVSYVHYQTLTGSAGAGASLPRIGYDEVQVRLYVRLLGHGGSFKR